MAKSRIRPGTLFEISTARGFAYIQYLGIHPTYGQTIRVLPGFATVSVAGGAAPPAGEGYIAFFPVTAAAAHGLIRSVGQLPIPTGMDVPTKLRRAGARSMDGRVVTWLITDGDTEVLRRELNPEERLLPIGSIWNHELLVLRLEQEWRPDDVRLMAPSAATVAGRGADSPRVITHFLYFRDEAVARRVAQTLRRTSLEMSVQRSPDAERWLLTLTERARYGAPRLLGDDELRAVASSNDGEFDGSEESVEAPS